MLKESENMNTSTLKTKRLILRKFTKNDIDALYLILKDEEVNKFLPWYPIKSMQEAEEFYEKRYASEYKKEKSYAYAVCLKKDDFPIGYVKIDTDDSFDLGCGLRKEFWNRGIITEAVKSVLKQAESDGLPFVTATHDKNNISSGKVMQKLQMKYCYSYEEQWQPKNFPVIFRMYQLNFNMPDKFVYKKYWNMHENHFIEKIQAQSEHDMV